MTIKSKGKATKYAFAKRHKNRDGSLGAYIPKNSRIHSQAILEAGVIVMPGAIVKKPRRIRNGHIVGPGEYIGRF